MIAKTQSEARRQAAIIERRRAFIERWAQPRIKRAYIQMGEKFAFLYEQGGEMRMRAFKDEAASIMEEVLADVYDRVVYSLRGLALDSRKSFYGLVETKDAEEEIDEATRLLISSFQEMAFTQSVYIADTLATELANVVIRDTDLLSEGPRAVVRAIRSHTGMMSVYKSQTIARTEVIAASSESQDKFTDSIWNEAEDGPLYKQWQANRGSRTRDDHRRMDGKIVPRDQKFKMPNNDELKYPGDRAGKPESIINCRCSYSVLPEELVPEKLRRSQA